VDPDGRTGRLRSDNGHQVHFPLNPFLGLVGLAPATEAELNSRPPGPYGGNLDIRHLGLGSSLLLTVRTDGALLYVGDPHFAQGNGEVALTAFEAPLRAQLRVTIERSAEARLLAAGMANPWGETAEHFIAIGLAETLDEAMRQAVTHALAIVTSVSGLDEATALSYLSAAADFEVSQAVNGTRGIHCMIRRSDLIPVGS
jgi:acetamidase/formamidase